MWIPGYVGWYLIMMLTFREEVGNRYRVVNQDGTAAAEGSYPNHDEGKWLVWILRMMSRGFDLFVYFLLYHYSRHPHVQPHIKDQSDPRRW